MPTSRYPRTDSDKPCPEPGSTLCILSPLLMGCKTRAIQPVSLPVKCK